MNMTIVVERLFCTIVKLNLKFIFERHNDDG